MYTDLVAITTVRKTARARARARARTNTHADIYDSIGRGIVEHVLEGKNGTIFAYGQTSAGKTHTLVGSPEEPGLTCLALEDLFHSCESKEDYEFLIRVSYIEIYNEEIRDLLKPDSPPLDLHEHPKTGPYVGGCVEKVVASADDALGWWTPFQKHLGARRRRTPRARTDPRVLWLPALDVRRRHAPKTIRAQAACSQTVRATDIWRRRT